MLCHSTAQKALRETLRDAEEQRLKAVEETEKAQEQRRVAEEDVEEAERVRGECVEQERFALCDYYVITM